MLQRVKKFFKWVIDWLWTRPVTRKTEPKATEVIHNYELIEYRGMNITMTNREKFLWENHLNRKQKNDILKNHKRKLQKGELIMVEINGQMVAVKNKQYGTNARTDIRVKAHEQSCTD